MDGSRVRIEQDRLGDRGVTAGRRRSSARVDDGHDVIVSLWRSPVAAVVGVARLVELEELERDLRSAGLVMSRALADTGERTSLDDASAALGFYRATLEAELDADRAAGRDRSLPEPMSAPAGPAAYVRLTTPPVGDRDWRIVWLVSADDGGGLVVDIAEIWAIGVREHGEIYRETATRLASAEPGQATTALTEVIERLGRTVGAIAATAPPQPVEPVPVWLAARLADQVGMSDQDIAALTPEQAMDTWEAFIARER